MKILLAFVMCFPFAVFSQDCKLKRETDQFSQQPRLASGFMNFSSTAGRASLNLVADAKEVRILLSMGEGSCFDGQSTASISFEGSKTKSSQRNATSMNCDGIFTIVFRNAAITPTALDKITRQKISSIIVTDNTKKKIEIHLKDEEQQKLMERADCLVKEAKGLIAPAR